MVLALPSVCHHRKLCIFGLIPCSPRLCQHVGAGGDPVVGHDGVRTVKNASASTGEASP